MNSKIANGRHQISTSNGTASRKSEKAIIGFFLESDSGFSSLKEESSDEQDENDSETEEEITLVESKYVDNIDNNNSIIDEEISEAPKSTSRARQKKEKIVINKYAGIKWQKEPPIGGMKKSLFSGVPGISAAVTTENPIDIFELMITLCEKCPYSGLFWSVFYRIWTEYGEILRISPYSVRIRENTKQNSSVTRCY